MPAAFSGQDLCRQPGRRRRRIGTWAPPSGRRSRSLPQASARSTGDELKRPALDASEVLVDVLGCRVSGDELGAVVDGLALAVRDEPDLERVPVAAFAGPRSEVSGRCSPSPSAGCSSSAARRAARTSSQQQGESDGGRRAARGEVSLYALDLSASRVVVAPLLNQAATLGGAHWSRPSCCAARGGPPTAREPPRSQAASAVRIEARSHEGWIPGCSSTAAATRYRAGRRPRRRCGAGDVGQLEQHRSTAGNSRAHPQDRRVRRSRTCKFPASSISPMSPVYRTSSLHRLRGPSGGRCSRAWSLAPAAGRDLRPYRYLTLCAGGNTSAVVVAGPSTER